MEGFKSQKQIFKINTEVDQGKSGAVWRMTSGSAKVYGGIWNFT